MTAQSQSNTGLRFWVSPLPGMLDGLTSLTITYWVYITRTLGSESLWGQGDASASCFLETNGSTTGPFWRGGSDLRGAFTEVLTVGEWQHIAWTANAGTTNYYRNGVLKQTSANGCGTISAATGNGMCIGGQQAGSGGGIVQAADGLWADFRVYPYLCTPNQVWELYSPRSRWDLYWQPNTRAYSFMSAAASAAGYLLVKN
jgi:hypothetical protein